MELIKYQSLRQRKIFGYYSANEKPNLQRKRKKKKKKEKAESVDFQSHFENSRRGRINRLPGWTLVIPNVQKHWFLVKAS